MCVLSLLFFVEPDPPVIVVSTISLLISATASFVGSHFWMRREESVEVSFHDLMLWSWWRRRRAEARVVRGAELLGLDASGRPFSDQPVIGRGQRLKILHELSAALESKDPYTHGHSQRVERHSFRVGAALGLSVTDLEDLRLAAALHDVGKIRVSTRILRKPGKLTPEEYKEIQDHSVVGAWMVSSVGNPDVISAVRHHHERFDGAGYPDGISGHEIPLFARIICVADAYDAITSTRSYRAKSDRDRAIRIIREESGKQFDPMVVNAFLASLPSAAPVTAALAFLLPGPSRVLRRVADVAREVGGAGVAETVRAASMTMVLSASVVAPVSQHMAPDRPKVAESFASPGDVSGSDQVLDASASSEEERTAAGEGTVLAAEKERAPEKEQGDTHAMALSPEAAALLEADGLPDDEPVVLPGAASGDLSGTLPGDVAGSTPGLGGDNPGAGRGDGKAKGNGNGDATAGGRNGDGNSGNGKGHGGGDHGGGKGNGNGNGNGGSGSTGVGKPDEGSGDGGNSDPGSTGQGPGNGNGNADTGTPGGGASSADNSTPGGSGETGDRNPGTGPSESGGGNGGGGNPAGGGSGGDSAGGNPRD